MECKSCTHFSVYVSVYVIVEDKVGLGCFRDTSPPIEKGREA